MPLVVPTTATVLPTAPSTSAPANFDAEADAFLGSLQTFRTQLNQLASDTYSNASYSYEQATTAAAQATTATTQAAAAAASASAAAASSGVTAWNSATNYSTGTVVYSLANFQTYRCKVAGVDATDPSLNSTKWAQILPPSMPVMVTTNTVTVTPFVKHVLQYSSGPIAITLPTLPFIGMEVAFDNATGRYDSYIVYNGTDKLFGLTENCMVDLVGPFTLVYYGSTLGWRLS